MHADVQGPFPLALLRHWQSQSPPAFHWEMPIAHISTPDIPVQLRVLLGRPLPVRPAAPDASSGLGPESGRPVPASRGSAATGVHAQRAPRSTRQQQPARVSEQPTGSLDCTTAQRADVNGDVGVAVPRASPIHTVSNAAVQKRQGIFALHWFCGRHKLLLRSFLRIASIPPHSCFSVALWFGCDSPGL